MKKLELEGRSESKGYLTLDILLIIFPLLEIMDLASSKNVCQVWHRAALTSALRKCKEYLPSSLMKEISDPVLVAYRIMLLIDKRNLLFEPSSLPNIVNIEKSVKTSRWLQHIVCYPYINADLNREAEKIFNKKRYCGETQKIAILANNFNVILLIQTRRLLSNVKADYKIKMQLYNDRFIANHYGIILLGKHLNEHDGKFCNKDVNQQLKNHGPSLELKLASKYYCQARIFEKIIYRNKWDDYCLIEIIYAKVIKSTWIHSEKIAERIFPFSYLNINDATEFGKYISALEEFSMEKYRVVYATLVSGNKELTVHLFNHFVNNKQLIKYPNPVIAGFILSFIKLDLVDHLNIIDNALRSSGSLVVNYSKACQINNDLKMAASHKLIRLGVFCTIYKNPPNRWKEILVEYGDAIITCLLTKTSDKFHHLIKTILDLDSEKTGEYFNKACCFGNIVIAKVTASTAINHTEKFRELQRAACAFGCIPIIKMMYELNCSPQPGLIDLDIIVSVGNIEALEYLLRVNSALRIDIFHLNIAAHYGQMEMLQYIIQNSSHLIPDQNTVILAMYSYQIHILEYLFSNYPNLVPYNIIKYPRNEKAFFIVSRNMCFKYTDRLQLFYSESWYLREDFCSLLKKYQDMRGMGYEESSNFEFNC